MIQKKEMIQRLNTLPLTFECRVDEGELAHSQQRKDKKKKKKKKIGGVPAMCDLLKGK